jgi:hypothetical protein
MGEMAFTLLVDSLLSASRPYDNSDDMTTLFILMLTGIRKVKLF